MSRCKGGPEPWGQGTSQVLRAGLSRHFVTGFGGRKSHLQLAFEAFVTEAWMVACLIN